jgi:hypothetical protein
VYSVSVLVAPAASPLEVRQSNEVPLMVAPRITSAMPATFSAGPISLTVSPEVRPEQRTSILLGGRDVVADTLTGQSATVSFDVSDVPPGVHWARVRVDGVESLLVDKSDPADPSFDASQQITIV